MKVGTVIAVGGVTLLVLGGGAFLLLRKRDGRSACDKLAAGAAMGAAAYKGVAIQPGIAQAAGSLACDILEPRGSFIGDHLDDILGYLPPVLLFKGAKALGEGVLKVGEAAIDTVGDVVTGTGRAIGSAVTGTGRTIGSIGGKAYDVTEDVIGAGVGAVGAAGRGIGSAAGAVGSGARKVISFVNPFD